MTEDTNNKNIINNYYYCSYEDLLKLMKSNSFYPFFLGQIQGNDSIQTKTNHVFLNKKRENTNITINNYIPSSIQILLNEKDNKEENVEKNPKIQTITLEESKNKNMVDEKKPKFLVEKKIFNINKKNKIGRMQKTSLIRGNHTKFSHDNILRKIRGKFCKRVINYINSIIISKNVNIKRLKPLKGKIAQNNNIKYNIKLLNSKLKDILSSNEINGKFKLFDKYHNKNVIYTIYSKNIKELIDILEMTFLDIFKIFRNSNETEKLIGLEKLDSVIREIKLKEKDDEYINKLIKVAMNFESYYVEKFSRKVN